MSPDHQQQFNAIATEYSKYVGQDPFRLFLHYPAVVEALRDCPHDRILDVGCGDGHLGELLSNTFRSYVVGYDIAPAQIEKARSRERARGGQNSYTVGKPETFAFEDPFDAAASVMVLPYAEHKDQLGVFFTYTHLAIHPDAKFVSVIFNPKFNAFNQVIGCRRFEQVADNDIRVCFLDQSGTTSFTSRLRQFTADDYEEAARSGGFTRFSFSELHPSAKGKKQLGGEFWQRCERTQPYALFTAQ